MKIKIKIKVNLVGRKTLQALFVLGLSAGLFVGVTAIRVIGFLVDLGLTKVVFAIKVFVFSG